MEERKYEKGFNVVIMIFYQIHMYIFQLLLVTGGATLYNGNGGIRISSTEVFSDNTWRFAGNLPNTMWGMSAVAFNNRVLVFGTKQSYF